MMSFVDVPQGIVTEKTLVIHEKNPLLSDIRMSNCQLRITNFTFVHECVPEAAHVILLVFDVNGHHKPAVWPFTARKANNARFDSFSFALRAFP